MSETVKLSDITPDTENANRHTERGTYMLRRSLERFGFLEPGVLDANGRIIGGNNRTVEAADVLNADDAIVIDIDGTRPVFVRRKDLDLTTPEGREAAIALNRSAQVGIDFDGDMLGAFQDMGVDLSDWFQPLELEGLGVDIGTQPEGDAEPQIDRAEELRQQWSVETGQLWRLPSRTPGQEHRLICGDCTDAAVVERVCDIPLILMVTDPPYGVNYDPNWRNEAAAEGKLSYAARRIGTVDNDDRVDWTEAWALFRGDVAYTWSPPGDHVIITGKALQDAGFDIRSMLVWRKPHFPISRGHYTYVHEPCWYAVKRGKTGHWIGPATERTVWDIALDKNVDGGHSTQKPVECMARPIRNHEGDVYEPFCGSGTTLIAAENLARQCRAVEISPGYVAVALQRYQDAFGIAPELVP